MRTGPENFQHFLCLWLFTDKQNRGTNEERHQVAIYAVIEERPHNLKNRAQLITNTLQWQGLHEL